ncbi:MAG TPA: hypothetical protein PLJ21_10835, partial [Pseudobdellovibrionaceae bacterium]|nr:hypothetical protein [Pseudobdellovibrionaceae bacterium]
MKYVITIENEPKLLAQIAEALFLSDPTLIIRNFNNIDGFENWLKSFNEHGASALKHAGYTLDEALDSALLTRQLDDIRKKNEAHSIKILGKELPEHLVLFLVKLEMIQKEQIQKLNGCMKTFQDLSVCTEEAPTSILFTAFESPTFKAKDFTFSNIGNIIFKPFDKPILNQQIFYALNGHQPAKSEYVFQQKTKATVEMIKEGEIEGFSEVGLVTLNDKKIEPGSFSKLYSKTIETEKLKSTSSVCVFSESNPTDPTQTLCYFKFFALKNEQILALRKNIKECKVTKLKNFKKPPIIDKMGRFFHVAIICPDDSAGPLEEALIRNFKMLKVSRFKESLDLMKLLKVEPTAFDSLIFVNSFFVDDPEKQTNSIKEMISQYNPLYEGAKSHLFPVFIISPHIYPKETEKEFTKIK